MSSSHHHVTSFQAYAKVFGALLVLTVVTVAIARVDLGPFNMIVAMAVATAKALLVALIFMHLKSDERLNGMVFGFGLLFVALFFIFTMADILTRDFVDPIRDNHAYREDQVRALEHQVLEARGATAVEAPAPADEMPESERPRPAPPPPPAPASVEGAAPAPTDGTTPAGPGSIPAPASAPTAPGSIPAPASAPAAP